MKHHHPWYDPVWQRQRQSAQLEHAADQILQRDDRRQRRQASMPVQGVGEPVPEVRGKGWRPLQDLKDLLRNGGV
jgi:hypothetical protein